jgi:hypothetical protein
LRSRSNQCSRIRYPRTLRTVIPSRPIAVLKITIRSGQSCRTMRVNKITAADPITVMAAPTAINTSMSLVLFKVSEPRCVRIGSVGRSDSSSTGTAVWFRTESRGVLSNSPLSGSVRRIHCGEIRHRNVPRRVRCISSGPLVQRFQQSRGHQSLPRALPFRRTPHVPDRSSRSGTQHGHAKHHRPSVQG